MREGPILHLFGSPTSAFWTDLSLAYASGAHAALAGDHAFVNALLSPGGCWRISDTLAPEDIEAAPELSHSQAIARIADYAPIAALPQMFCHRGMTDYRGLVEAIGIPLIGNPAHVMAIAADKAWTRALMEAAGIAMPKAQVLHRGDIPGLALPFIVKPASADNSAGIALAGTPEEAEDAIEAAFAFGSRVIIEQFIAPGREVRCGVVEQAGRAVPLPLEEYPLDPETRPIRLAADKIRADESGVALMAKTEGAAWIVPESDLATAPVQRLALAAHQALGARDYSLFDFRIDPAGRPFLLEAGPYCSFSPDSVLTIMMEAAGTPLPQFFAQAVHRAKARRFSPEHYETMPERT